MKNLITSFTTPFLIFEIILSIADLGSDSTTSYSLLVTLDQKRWGIGSIVINWIPGFIGCCHMLAHYRRNSDYSRKFKITFALVCLIFCPLVPTASFIYLLYMKPTPKDFEINPNEFSKKYSRYVDK